MVSVIKGEGGVQYGRLRGIWREGGAMLSLYSLDLSLGPTFWAKYLNLSKAVSPESGKSFATYILGFENL